VGRKLFGKSGDEILEKLLKNLKAFVSWLSSSFLISLELPITLRILFSKYLIFLMFAFSICGVKWMVSPFNYGSPL